MTTRLKTIEYGFETVNTTLTAASRRDLAAINVYIPEASGTITFKSVEVQIDFNGDNTTAGNATAVLVGIKLGAVAFNDATLPDKGANSTETETFRYTRNVTPYFDTNWSGVLMTCQVGMQISTIATIGHCATLRITYEYDDTQPTHIKTVYIPIESTVPSLTTSPKRVGGAASIPALISPTTPWLPESGVVIRNAFLEIMANDACNSATARFTGAYQISGGYSQTKTGVFCIPNTTLNSSCWHSKNIDLTSISGFFTGTQDVYMFSQGTTARWDNPCGLMRVTYEFDPAASTTILNSTITAGCDEAGFLKGINSGNCNTYNSSLFIEEPEPIGLRQSAIYAFFNSATSTNIIFGAGTQTGVSRLPLAGALQCGQYSLCHRIDGSGVDAGTISPLTRGENNIQTYWFSPAIRNNIANISAFKVVNYTSSKSPQGVGAHNHSCYYMLSGFIGNTSGSIYQVVNTPAGYIPEPYYRMNGVVSYIYYATTADAVANFVLSMQIHSGENNNRNGWEDLYNSTYVGDSENSFGTMYGACRTSFIRYTGDAGDGRYDIERPRNWLFECPGIADAGFGMWYNYHSIRYPVTGVITNYTGDGANILVKGYRWNPPHEKIFTTTTTTGGVFSGIWYSDTDPIYVTAYQDGTHVGSSPTGFAGS